MKTRRLNLHRAGWFFLFLTAFLSAFGQVTPPASVINSSQTPAAGGGGDSGIPIISPDGRYVLFASTAGNLAVISNSTPMTTRVFAPLNVFLRDRTNGTTVLVSVNLTGTGGGDSDSLPVGVSTNGRYAVFESSASDLIPGDTNGVADVFVRDLVLGTTILVSISTNGTVGNGASGSATMTPDGRYVAFSSAATNLVVGDTNAITDVFVRDLQTATTILVSTGSIPVSASSTSDSPDITPDGRYVAYCSTAVNMFAAALNIRDIYIRDLVAGTTICASSGAKAQALAVLNASQIYCYNHSISDDGNFVAYQASSALSPTFPGLILRYNATSGLTDLVHTNAAIEQTPGNLDIRTLDMTPDGQNIVFVASTNGTSGTTTCILLWNAGTGAISLVSGNTNGNVVTNAFCDWPSVDTGGRYVVFNSSAAGLVTNTLSAGFHLFRRDLTTGKTTWLDADTNAPFSAVSSFTVPCLSADGRFAVFASDDGALLPNDRNRASDVFLRDFNTDVFEMISAHHPSLPSFTPNGPSYISANCLSTDGRYVAFASDGNNLVANDTNNWRDVFVHDCTNGTTVLASGGTNGSGGDNMSYEPSLSGDGRLVAFTSQADNLVSGDNNRASDVFVRDLQSNTTTLVSVKFPGGGPGNTNSYSPTISSGGRYVLFRSMANNLATGTFTGTENLLLRDLQAATNMPLTMAGLSCAAMTPDAHYVAYVESGNKLYIWNSTLGKRVYTNITAVFTNVAISPDGSRLAYWTATPRLIVTNLGAGLSWTANSNFPAFRPGLRFSVDNKFLTYAAVSGNTRQVYLYDFVAGTNVLVSHADGSTQAGNGFSDSPDISSDGRFVAFRSSATNLVSGDTNGVSDVFVFDRQTGVTTLLASSHYGSTAANNRSTSPIFSGDGQTLVFRTWATDLADGDFNQASDLLSYSVYAYAPISLFSAGIVPGTPGQGPWITWQAVPGRTYHVQFKTDLYDGWQELGGTVSIAGNQGYCQDIAPGPTQRFYRVVGQ